MLDFGAISIEWGALIFELVILLIFLAVPIAIVFRMARSSVKRDRRMEDLESRITILERNMKDQ